jgi:K(+)-stimulated pyrophosphate-energized sodium pump
LPQALKVSFGGGTVMGLGVAFSRSRFNFFLYLFFHFFMNGTWTSMDMTIVLETLASFLLEQNQLPCLLV